MTVVTALERLSSIAAFLDDVVKLGVDARKLARAAGAEAHYFRCGRRMSATSLVDEETEMTLILILLLILIFGGKAATTHMAGMAAAASASWA